MSCKIQKNSVGRIMSAAPARTPARTNFALCTLHFALFAVQADQTAKHTTTKFGNNPLFAYKITVGKVSQPKIVAPCAQRPHARLKLHKGKITDNASSGVNQANPKSPNKRHKPAASMGMPKKPTGTKYEFCVTKLRGCNQGKSRSRSKFICREPVRAKCRPITATAVSSGLIKTVAPSQGRIKKEALKITSNMAIPTDFPTRLNTKTSYHVSPGRKILGGFFCSLKYATLFL